jgi:hypothetical protein
MDRSVPIVFCAANRLCIEYQLRSNLCPDSYVVVFVPAAAGTRQVWKFTELT